MTKTGERLDNARKAYSNGRTEWARNYWRYIIEYLMRKLKRKL